VRLGNARFVGAFAALGLTATAAVVALSPSVPASTHRLDIPGSSVLVPRAQGAATMPSGATALPARTSDKLADPGHHELELTELGALAAERNLAVDEADDAAALLETIKTARAGAVEQATRAAERERIANAPPRETGQILAAERGFTGDQWSCLDSLWLRESNWNPYAQNRSSGAYGIPQALPGSKMATVAPDWQTNPATQITWGLNYIVARYGTPCGAWNHSQGYGWY